MAGNASLAAFCRRTQLEFVTMGCPSRGSSSHQCMVRAVEYASSCASDASLCATPLDVVVVNMITTSALTALALCAYLSARHFARCPKTAHQTF